MVWTVEFTDAARKDLAALDRQVARRILAFLRERIAVDEDPRRLGQALKGSRFGDFWKYRVGDYRVIVQIEDGLLRVLILSVGDRKEVYR